MERTNTTDASVGELISRLSEQSSRLVRDEMRLAQRELSESVKQAGKGAGIISAAGLLAVLALIALLAAAIAALALIMPVWASALIVSGVLLAAAGVAGLVSRRQFKQISPAPEQTITNVKRDIEEVKDARHAR